MATNVQVEKTGGESGASLIRRFTKRVQGAGILPEMRSRRYQVRTASPNTKKKHALKRIARREKYEELMKLGKIADRSERRNTK
jgi:ribosomal protein S21